MFSSTLWFITLSAASEKIPCICDGLELQIHISMYSNCTFQSGKYVYFFFHLLKSHGNKILKLRCLINQQSMCVL